MMTFAIILAVLYIIQMGFYISGWQKIKTIKDAAYTNGEYISVVIPIRNDALKLEMCLTTISAWGIGNDRFEVIVVDDHSEDNPYACVQKINAPNIRFVTLPEDSYGKKAALTYGIKTAKGALIATLDADANPCKNWLATMYVYISTAQYKLVTGPVLFTKTTSFLESFQALDNMGMMLITGGSIAQGLPIMANGTNMLFYKSVFDEVNGYDSSNNKASGDDTTLIQKVSVHFGAQYVGFAKSNEAVVYTQAQPTFNGFMQQRRRWASKAFTYIDKRTTALLAFNYVYALAVIYALVFLFMTGDYIPFTILFVAKWYMDSIVVYAAARFFRTMVPMLKLWLAILLHVPYVLWVGASGVLKPVDWKGREV